MFGRARKKQSEEAARLAMVEHQVQARGVRDALVLEAMRRIPRHEFVPEGQRSRSYEDCPLPIGNVSSRMTFFSSSRMTIVPVANTSSSSNS